MDLENTGSRIQSIIDSTRQHDRIYIVYSKQACTLDVRVYESMLRHLVHPRFIYSPMQGHNAADFVLSAELSVTCEHHPGARHVIVSNDQGFKAVVEYLRHKGYAVELQGSIPEPKLTEREQKILEECRGKDLVHLNTVCGKYAKGAEQSKLYHKLRGYIKCMEK